MFANLNAPPAFAAEDTRPEFRQIDEERAPRVITQITEVERVEEGEEEAPPPVPETSFHEEALEEVRGGLDFLE